MSKEKTRNYSYEVSADTLDSVVKLSGYDYFKKVIEGDISMPPCFTTVACLPVSVEKGEVVFQLKAEEFQYNTMGSVNGGIISAILDFATGCSLHSLLEAGEAYTSLDVKANFLRKITVDSPILRTRTKIIHKGRTTAYLETELVDEEGKVYAHGVSSCLIFRSK